jgi:thiol-disulfide isomerase/thioredoxin
MNTAQNQLAPARPQQCSVAGLYRIWGAYAAGLAIFAFAANWIGFGLFLLLVPIGKLVQMRFYSQLSSLFGYGPIANDQFPPSVAISSATVTYYSALGCPFCPIVLQRLQALQKQMGFKLQTINLSLNPQLAVTRRIQSVPVVEVDGNRLVGNVTSEQLADLIAPSPVLIQQPAPVGNLTAVS